MHAKKSNTLPTYGSGNRNLNTDAKNVFTSYNSNNEEDSFDWVGTSTGQDSNPKKSNLHGGGIGKGLKPINEEKKSTSYDKDSFDWIGTSKGQESNVKKSNVHGGMGQGLKPINEERNQSSYGSEFERSQTELAESKVYDDTMNYSKDIRSNLKNSNQRSDYGKSKYNTYDDRLKPGSAQFSPQKNEGGLTFGRNTRNMTPDEIRTSQELQIEKNLDRFVTEKQEPLKDGELYESINPNYSDFGKSHVIGPDHAHQHKHQCKIPETDIKRFKSMSEKEQSRNYTTYTDQNRNLFKEVKASEQILEDLIIKNSLLENKESFKELQGENQRLESQVTRIEEEVKELEMKKVQYSVADQKLKKQLNPKKRTLKPTTYNKGKGGYNTKSSALQKDDIFQGKRVFTRDELQNHCDVVKNDKRDIEKGIQSIKDFLKSHGIKFEKDQIHSAKVTQDYVQDDFMQADIKTKRLKLIEHESMYDTFDFEHKSLSKKNELQERTVKEISSKLQSIENINLAKRKRIIEWESLNPRALKDELMRLKHREKELASRIEQFCNNRFFKAGGQMINNRQKFEQAQRMIVDTKAKINVMEENIDHVEAEIKELKQKIDRTKQETRKAKENYIETKTIYEETIRNKDIYTVNAMRKEAKKAFGETPMDKEMQETDDKYEQALGLIRWTGEEPAWVKLDLLERTRIKDIKNDKLTQQEVKEEVKRLHEEKIDLGQKLIKVQTVLKSHIDIEKAKDQQHLFEVKNKEYTLMELKNQIEEYESLMSKIDPRKHKLVPSIDARTGKDIYYDDTVSVFEEYPSDYEGLNSWDNIFDIYLGVVEWDLKALEQFCLINKMNTENLRFIEYQSLLDFYNFETVKIPMKAGLSTNVNFQTSFNFGVTANFINYMNSGEFEVDFYMADSMPEQVLDTSKLKIGTACIGLKGLLEMNRELKRNDSSAVLDHMAFIKAFDKNDSELVLGTLNYRIRTRFPIYRYIEKFEEFYNKELTKENLMKKQDIDFLLLNKKRKLKINIQHARMGKGGSNMKSFVSYNFYEDERKFTESIKSDNPEYNQDFEHDLVFDVHMNSYLRNENLDFLIFDDSKPLNTNSGDVRDFILGSNEYGSINRVDDFIGTAKLPLYDLSKNINFNGPVSIKDVHGKVIGDIFVAVYWFDDYADTYIAKIPEAAYGKEWEKNVSYSIIDSIRKRRLTIQSALGFSEKIGYDTVTKEQFMIKVLQGLELNLTKDEYEVYWKRLVRRHYDKDKVSYGHFLAYFSPYLDPSLLGVDYRDLKEYSLDEYIKGIKNAFADPSILEVKAIDLVDERKIEELKTRLQNELKRREVSLTKFLESFQHDGDKNVNRAEFISTIIDDMKLPFTQEDLNNIFDFMDKDKNGTLNIQEFAKILNFDINEFKMQKSMREKELNKAMQSQMSTSFDRSKKFTEDEENFVREFQDHANNYIRNKNQNFTELFDIVDKNNSGSINEAELRELINNYFKLNYDKQKISVIFSRIDTSGNGFISPKEFLNMLNLRDQMAFLSNKKAVSQIEKLNILKSLYGFIIRTDIPLENLFHKIDVDNSNTLEYVDLVGFLRLENKVHSNEDFQEFYSYFDKDGNRNQDLQEFRIALETYDKIVNKNDKTKSHNELKVVWLKLEKLLDEHEADLKNIFKKKEVRDGLIKEKDFKETMKSVRGWTDEDVEILLNPICNEYIVFGKLKWRYFLDVIRTVDNNSMANSFMRNSGLDGLTGPQLVSKFFRMLTEIQKRHKKDPYDLYTAFDTNGDGFIKMEELREIFDQIDFNISDEQLEEFRKTVDINNDGKLNYYEFQTYLKKAQQDY